jgi:hypothetical protein
MTGAAGILARALDAAAPSLLQRRELLALRFALRPDRLATDERQDARRAYLGTLARTTRLLARTGALLDAAEADGLPMLPYKGALFADALYGDPGLRPLGDVDVIAPPGERARAEALVARLGFRRLFEGPRFEEGYAHDVAYLAVDDPDCIVELHLALFHDFVARGAGDVAPLFARAQRLAVLGRERLAPSWDDHLFAVLVHAASHALGDHPSWPFDVVLLVAAGADPARARDEADRRHLGLAFDWAWEAGRRALGPAWPDGLAPRRRTAAGRLLLDGLRGTAPWVAPAGRLVGLATRAVLVEGALPRAQFMSSKIKLRARELLHRRSPAAS